MGQMPKMVNFSQYRKRKELKTALVMALLPVCLWSVCQRNAVATGQTTDINDIIRGGTY